MKKFANLYLTLVFIILYIPIAYLIFYSFNEGGDMNGFTGFTLGGCRRVLADGGGVGVVVRGGRLSVAISPTLFHWWCCWVCLDCNI